MWGLLLLTTSPLDVPQGVQTPRVQWVPPHVSSSGQEAVELAAECGLVLDPWQRLIMDGALGEQANGKWSAFEVGVEVSRQNGKGSVLEARELAGLFLFGEKLIVHSAHLFETSLEHMERMLQLIESSDDMWKQVDRVSRAHGQEGITLTRKYRRARLKFKTRTKGGGRGLSGDLVVFDEAMEIQEASQSALMPVLSAHPNPQLWYTGSAVDQMIHANGVVFARIRKRGQAGGDPSLAWYEWSVDPEEYAADPISVSAGPRYWAQANPGYQIRITHEYIGNEHRSLSPRGFAAERLGVGDWPDTDSSEDQVIPRETWDGLADMDSQIDGPIAFAFDVNPERSYAAIGAAGRRKDGRKHLEVIDHKAGTRWVVPELLRLVDRWSPCVIVVDGNGPASSLLAEIEEAGVGLKADGGLLVKATMQDMAQACGALFDAALSDDLRHLGQSMLDVALRGARKRDRGDAWTWSRQSGADISPLVAVTLAAHGHSIYGHTPDLTPVMVVT
jgi:hypothetical protein